MTKLLERNTHERSVSIDADSAQLNGNLTIPEEAEGIIVLAHGNGSHRHNRVNHYVAQIFCEMNLATLLINLLTSDEEAIDMRTQHFRFDISFLASRLSRVTDWLLHNPDTRHLKIGYFSTNTESAAALVAATEHPEAVRAIVSRSGRTDLVGSELCHLQTPTLLIVGEKDFPTVGANEDALAQIPVRKQLVLVPGATHLFEEQGALETAIELAIQWFRYYLAHEEKIKRLQVGF